MISTPKLAIIAVLCWTIPLAAGEITVPGDHPTIQDAIDAAVDGDEIIVAPGTYVENIDLGTKTIVVRSESGDPTDTVIDGGGGLHTVQSGAGGSGTRIEGFTITGGSATGTGPDGGSGPDTWGGGLYNSGGFLEVINCVFHGNTATNFGGGLANFGRLTVLNCFFCGNTAAGDFGRGGGMYNGVLASVTNCAFSGNTADGLFGKGGAVSSSGTDSYVNCSFSNNSASSGGGVTVQGSAMISESLFKDNAPDDVQVESLAESMLFNCFASSITGTGNCACNSTWAGDPKFVDADGADNTVGTPDDDLRLDATSFAIDNAIMRNYAHTDLDGNARLAGDAVDQGAYEYGSTPPGDGGSCPADTNGDNVVNVTDLLNLLAAWGSCF